MVPVKLLGEAGTYGHWRLKVRYPTMIGDTAMIDKGAVIEAADSCIVLVKDGMCWRWNGRAYEPDTKLCPEWFSEKEGANSIEIQFAQAKYERQRRMA